MSTGRATKDAAIEAEPAGTGAGPGAAAPSFGKALLLAARNFGGDGCFNHSAAISYYALLSVIPFVSLVASILGSLLGSSEEGLAAAFDRFNMLVPGLGEEMVGAVQSFVGNRSTIGVASGLAVLWVSSFVFVAVQTAVNQIFRQSVETLSWRRLARRALWVYVKPFLMFVSATILLVMSFVAGNVLAVLRGAAPDAARGAIDWLEAIPSVPVIGSLLLTVAMFALMIQVLTARLLSWRVLGWSALVGGFAWEGAKSLISAYLGHVASALSFTGSAAAALIFMLWIYYAAAILLYSVEMAAILSGQRR